MTAAVGFNDDPQAELTTAGLIHRQLLTDQKFHLLDQSLDRLVSTKSLCSDGEWKHQGAIGSVGTIDLALDRDVIEDIARFLRLVDKDKPWKSKITLLRDWQAACPRSVSAATALASLYFQYAWDARGGDYAENVSDAAWKTFFARIRSASDVLRSVERDANRCPAWYGYSLLAVKADERTQGEWYAVFERGASQFPLYWGTYTRGADFHLVRWSGSPRQMDDFLRRAVAITQSQAGSSAAARIIWSLLCGYGAHSVDELCEQDWRLVRDGFEDWMALCPRQSVANYFLLTARVFDDRDTARQLIRKIGATPYASVWDEHLPSVFGGYNGVRNWAGM